MKGYTVFNLEQIDGLPEHYYAKAEPKGDPVKLIESAEAFFAATGATFRHGGDRAYYAPGPDCIQLPPPEAFKDAESYAGANRMKRFTGQATRLVWRVSWANGSAITLMRQRSSSGNLAPPIFAPISASRRSRELIMPRT